MERYSSEADGITLSALRTVGAPVDDIESVKDLTSTLFIPIIAHCLPLINPDVSDLPSSLPDSLPMTTKFKACTKMATTFKELGYMGDIGYQSFLYPSENDIRSILRWIVEHLPRSSSPSAGPSMSSLLSLVSESVRSWSSSPSTASHSLPVEPYLTEPPLHHLSPSCLSSISLSVAHQLTLRELEEEHLPVPSGKFAARKKAAIKELTKTLEQKPEKPSSKKLLDNLITELQSDSQANTTINTSRFALASDFAVDNTNTVAVRGVNDNEEDIEEEIASVQVEVDELSESCQVLHDALGQAEEELVTIQDDKESLEKSFERAKLIVSMIDDVDGNAERLTGEINDKKEQLKGLKEKSGEAMKILNDEKSSLVNERQSAVDTLENLVTDHKETRVCGKSLVTEVQTLQEQLKAIEIKMEKASNSKSRSYYIERMREAQKSVKKQRDEIHKILGDVHFVEKDLKTIRTGLEAEFSTLEGILKGFKSKKDPSFITLHNNFLSVHSAFLKTVKLIEQVGELTAELRETETLLSTEQTKLLGLNVSDIKRDLKMIKQENAELKRSKKN
ncbi:hypothetical protein P9112_001788 [Eukaryota sp. TZLM1-RC]